MTAFPKSILTILTLTTLTAKYTKGTVLFVYFFLVVCKPPD